MATYPTPVAERLLALPSLFLRMNVASIETPKANHNNGAASHSRQIAQPHRSHRPTCAANANRYDVRSRATRKVKHVRAVPEVPARRGRRGRTSRTQTLNRARLSIALIDSERTQFGISVRCDHAERARGWRAESGRYGSSVGSSVLMPPRLTPSLFAR
jgi:hypothetical protein